MIRIMCGLGNKEYAERVEGNTHPGGLIAGTIEGANIDE